MPSELSAKENDETSVYDPLVRGKCSSKKFLANAITLSPRIGLYAPARVAPSSSEIISVP